MAAVVHQTSNTATSPFIMGTQEKQQHLQASPVLQLRRAVYVHISDLTSTYNIDHGMLEEEIARVKAKQEDKTRHTMTLSSTPHHPHHSLDTFTAASAASATTSTITTSSSFGGVPTELDTSSAFQRRLLPPRTGYNLCVLVGKVIMVVDKKRVDGNRVRLAEVEVGDETGTVSLRARGDQIDILEEVSQRSGPVVLRNCTLELYQGKHIRLAVTKWGKLAKYPDQIASTPPPPSKINRDRNFSLIDLSKVASEMVSFSPATNKDEENQANRPQQPYSNQGGRGRGRRPQGPGRTKPAPPPSPHYGDITYAATGLHGYGGVVDPMTTTTSAYHYAPPPPRQPDNNPQQQQQQQQQHRMMRQQQQQRHHHHHHHRMHQQPPSPMYLIQDRGMMVHPSSPMTPPAIPPAGSFETTSFGPPPPQSNPFMLPLPAAATPTSGSSGSTQYQHHQQQPQQHHQQQPQQQPQQQQHPQQQPTSLSPQAATFDPSTSHN